MPQFKAGDPADLPSPNLFTGDLQCIINEINVITDQIQLVHNF